MKVLRNGLLLVALGLSAPSVFAQDAPFSTPSLEQTLICTYPNVTNYPEVANYCNSVVVPYVCSYINVNGVAGLPNYMTLWITPCNIYKVGSPPPG